ncbi:hypothetical protein NNJEOMEG_01716 [Fundidesulfovibrio magnetotacticus]|uniref:Uncharacterized protein n=1 Tax=Fundidesulfovibrio magnetotacticus TaxID=2730080 RepID=A0A6V8LU71_9BACT|nr:hypothetical protein NNJEOMEG_01716 [Fundidesulfovibrio magnetotacticus]
MSILYYISPRLANDSGQHIKDFEKMFMLLIHTSNIKKIFWFP